MQIIAVAFITYLKSIAIGIFFELGNCVCNVGFRFLTLKHPLVVSFNSHVCPEERLACVVGK